MSLRTPEGVRERLEHLPKNHRDPTLYEHLSYMINHNWTFTQETRENILKLAKTRRDLFTNKQWRNIQNDLSNQTIPKLYCDDDDVFCPGDDVPDGITEYEWEEYFNQYD